MADKRIGYQFPSSLGEFYFDALECFEDEEDGIIN